MKWILDGIFTTSYQEIFLKLAHWSFKIHNIKMLYDEACLSSNATFFLDTAWELMTAFFAVLYLSPCQRQKRAQDLLLRQILQAGTASL